MATQLAPQEQIVRLLDLPGVREDTRAIFGALLGACEDKSRLSEFILESISARLSTRVPQNIAFVCCCGCRRVYSPIDVEARSTSESLNDEGNRWLADFLLYPIGKRGGREERNVASSAMLSHAYERNTLPAQSGTLGDSSDRILPRYKSVPAIWERPEAQPPQGPSGDQARDLQLVRLFPESGDRERLSRFRVLVNAFHSGFEVALSDDNLNSPRNALYMHSVLGDMVDEGGLCFMIVDGQVQAIPSWQEPLVDPHPQDSLHRIPQSNVTGVDPDLVRLHEIIMKTWLATGLSSRFLSDMRWIQCLPLSSQNAFALGVDLFSGVLHHRLAIV